MKKKRTYSPGSFTFYLFSTKGFTLVELLVVIIIIGILSAGLLTLIDPVGQFKKARDVQRKSDLAQIKKALDAYNIDHGSYPATIDFGGTTLAPYLPTIPKDPSSTQQYIYKQENNDTYRLFAQLEKCQNDNQIIADIDCYTALCNYSVVSPNTTVRAYNPAIDGGTPGCGYPAPTPGPTSTPAPTPTTGPTNTPPPPTPTPGIFKYAFVTGQTYNGNLKSNGGSTTTGLQGAYNICTNLANSATALPALHNRTWKAWLSDSTTDPARQNWWQGEYRLADGTTIVASNWADLTDGSIQHPINITEDGSVLYTGGVWHVWTSTGTTGSAFGALSSYYCDDWKSSLSGDTAVNDGAAQSQDSNWTSYAAQGQVGCNNINVRLYCFEQETPPTPTPTSTSTPTPTPTQGPIQNPYTCITTLPAPDSVCYTSDQSRIAGNGGWVGTVPSCGQSGTFRGCSNWSGSGASACTGARSFGDACTPCYSGPGNYTWKIMDYTEIRSC